MDFSWTTIIQGVITSAIGGVLVFSVTRGRGWWSKAKAKHETRPADGKKFTLLVAELEGDEDKKQTGHVIAELEKQFPPRGDASLHIIPYPDVLSIGHGERSAALEAAEKKGRTWLTKKHSDVLIWGEVADKNKVLRLRFVTPRDGGAAKPYSLNEKLELPVDFGSDLGAVLAAQAATAISPVYDRSGEALAALIAPIVAKLKPLAESPPASFPDETRAQLCNAYAAGEARLGEERGDNARLASAIAYYKKALTIWTRDKVPLDWAMTQNNLGNALWTLGEREGGAARLEEAVSANREALKERTSKRAPLQWAATQNNLGTALHRVGERESGTARLEEAAEAFREALKERTRVRVPLHWAATQNNLGEALRAIGEREKGTARLEVAVTAYRSALRERTRERVPLDWATTQNNLGNALARLGERGTVHGASRRGSDGLSGGTEGECTRTRVPLQWGMTQNNLGSTLRVLGEREAEIDKAKSCATLKTARDHYAAALEEFQRVGASYYVEETQGNVAWLDGVIGRLCGG